MKDIIFEDISKKSIAEIKQIIENIKNKIDTYDIYDVQQLVDILNNDKRKSTKKMSLSLLKSINDLKIEKDRVKKLYDFDLSFLKNNTHYIAGVDEVGRGPLAGPIVAASVILNLNYKDDNDFILYINDSKKLNSKKRKQLAQIIKEKALCFSISSCSNEEIDKYGIAYCNNKVFSNCIEKLSIKPDIVLSDGYKIKNVDFTNEAIIKGDNKSASIACASIIAKVYRDEVMINLSNKYPGYGFEKNVGYGTKEHIKAIKEKGILDIHRKSFLTNII